MDNIYNDASVLCIHRRACSVLFRLQPPVWELDVRNECTFVNFNTCIHPYCIKVGKIKPKNSYIRWITFVYCVNSILRWILSFTCRTWSLLGVFICILFCVCASQSDILIWFWEQHQNISIFGLGALEENLFNIQLLQ